MADKASSENVQAPNPNNLDSLGAKASEKSSASDTTGGSELNLLTLSSGHAANKQNQTLVRLGGEGLWGQYPKTLTLDCGISPSNQAFGVAGNVFGDKGAPMAVPHAVVESDIFSPNGLPMLNGYPDGQYVLSLGGGQNNIFKVEAGGIDWRAVINNTESGPRLVEIENQNVVYGQPAPLKQAELVSAQKDANRIQTQLDSNPHWNELLGSDFQQVRQGLAQTNDPANSQEANARIIKWNDQVERLCASNKISEGDRQILKLERDPDLAGFDAKTQTSFTPSNPALWQQYEYYANSPGNSPLRYNSRSVNQANNLAGLLEKAADSGMTLDQGLINSTLARCGVDVMAAAANASNPMQIAISCGRKDVSQALYQQLQRQLPQFTQSYENYMREAPQRYADTINTWNGSVESLRRHGQLSGGGEQLHSLRKSSDPDFQRVSSDAGQFTRDTPEKEARWNGLVQGANSQLSRPPLPGYEAALVNRAGRLISALEQAANSGQTIDYALIDKIMDQTGANADHTLPVEDLAIAVAPDAVSRKLYEHLQRVPVRGTSVSSESNIRVLSVSNLDRLSYENYMADANQEWGPKVAQTAPQKANEFAPGRDTTRPVDIRLDWDVSTWAAVAASTKRTLIPGSKDWQALERLERHLRGGTVDPDATAKIKKLFAGYETAPGSELRNIVEEIGEIK
jgi:hypothetical protein